MATTPVSSTTSTASTTTTADIQAANKAAAQRLLTAMNAGSGVDTASLAQNLVDAERIPKENAINDKIAKSESKISGVSAVAFMMNELKTKLAALKDRDGYNTLSVANSNETALNLTAGTGATAGTYDITVASLAKPQKTQSAGLASATTAIGGANLKLSIGGDRAGVLAGTAPYRAFLSGVQFKNSKNDFANFKATIDGTVFTVPTQPTSNTLEALATAVQTGLRQQASDNTLNVSVTAAGDLMVSSTNTARRISALSLTASTKPVAGSASVASGPAASIKAVSVDPLLSADWTDFTDLKLTVDGNAIDLDLTQNPPTGITSLADYAQYLNNDATLSGAGVTVTADGSNLNFQSSNGESLTDLSLTSVGNADPGTPSYGQMAAVSGAAFSSVPAASDFSSFSLKINGTTYTAQLPLASQDTTMSGLAGSLQAYFRNLSPSPDSTLTISADNNGKLSLYSSNPDITISAPALTVSNSSWTAPVTGSQIVNSSAGSTVLLRNLSFGTQPSVTDFREFSIKIDGKAYTLQPSPATADLTALATDLQQQLRTITGGTDMNVQVSGNSLQFWSTQSGRVLADPQLSTSATIALDTGASGGTTSLSGSSISGVHFGTVPATTDFEKMQVKIGDVTRTIFLAPDTADMSALAADIQKRLRVLDGNDDMSVIATGDTLSFQSASGKQISGATLSPTTYANTPQGIVSRINDANRGVKAELINTGAANNPVQIVLSGQAGSSETFGVTSNASELSFSTLQTNQASDAVLTVNGITYNRKTNSLSDVIAGATIDLRAPTTSANVVLSRDTSQVRSRLVDLVTAYNDFDNIVKETTDPKSELDTYGKTLVGDSTVRLVRQQVRSLFLGKSSTSATTINSLADLGFKTDDKGVLSLDEAKLDTALKGNYDDIVKALTGNQNNISQYSTQPAGAIGDTFRRVTQLTAADGPLLAKSTTATSDIERYKKQLAELKVKMETLLERYTKQFAVMNSLVGSVNSQKSSLKSTFDGMMSMYSGK
jgi:flagellar hook-associated protein 2